MGKVCVSRKQSGSWSLITDRQSVVKKLKAQQIKN